MLAQTPLAGEKALPSFQVEASQAASSQDVASRRSARFLWTALGFAILMLIGATARIGSRPPKRHLLFERLASVTAQQSKGFFAPGAARPLYVLPLQSETTLAKVSNLRTARHGASIASLSAVETEGHHPFRDSLNGIHTRRQRSIVIPGPGSPYQTGLDRFRHVDPPLLSAANLEEEIPDWVQLSTRRQDVYFPELRDSVPVLEATNPSLESHALEDAKERIRMARAELLYNSGDRKACADKTYEACLRDIQDRVVGVELWPASFVVAKSVLRLLKEDEELRRAASDIADKELGVIDVSPPTSPSTMGQGKRVMEIACGVGLPSLAALRSGATVTSTEHLADPLHLVSESAKLQPNAATQRHHVVYLDLFDSQTSLDLLAEIQPHIVVASEVDWGHPQLARALGRFMGAAAAGGAGIVASIDGTGPDIGHGWDAFFMAFNEAVYDFFHHSRRSTHWHFFAANMASLEVVREEAIPASIVNNTRAPGPLAKFFGKSTSIFEIGIGALDVRGIGDPAHHHAGDWYSSDRAVREVSRR